MPHLAVVLWIANILLDTAGHLAFKSAATGDWKSMLRSSRLWGGIACFALEFVAWLALLSLIPLSQAVLIGSINIVVVMMAGRLMFHERLDATRLAAMSLIAVGVALAGRFA